MAIELRGYVLLQKNCGSAKAGKSATHETHELKHVSTQERPFSVRDSTAAEANTSAYTPGAVDQVADLHNRRQQEIRHLHCTGVLHEMHCSRLCCDSSRHATTT